MILGHLYANLHLEEKYVIVKSDRYYMYLIWQEEREKNKKYQWDF